MDLDAYKIPCMSIRQVKTYTIKNPPEPLIITEIPNHSIAIYRNTRFFSQFTIDEKRSVDGNLYLVIDDSTFEYCEDGETIVFTILYTPDLNDLYDQLPDLICLPDDNITNITVNEHLDKESIILSIQGKLDKPGTIKYTPNVYIPSNISNRVFQTHVENCLINTVTYVYPDQQMFCPIVYLIIQNTDPFKFSIIM